jgi:hypothetical protein
MCVSLDVLMFCDDDGLVVTTIQTLAWTTKRYVKTTRYVSWWQSSTFKLHDLKPNVEVMLEVRTYHQVWHDLKRFNIFESTTQGFKNIH